MLNLLKSNKMFRWLLSYQIFSGLGGGIFSLFMLLSVHLLYENPMYTGIAGMLIAGPQILSFAVGPVVDRRNKVTIMRITTLLEFSVLAVLAFTPILESVGVMALFTAVLLFSCAALFEGPAGTALLPQIVDENQIVEANSLVQIGAMSGGILVAIGLFFGLGDTGMDLTLIYGVSAVFLALAFIVSLFIKDPNAKTAKIAPKTSYMADLREGGRFIRSNVLLFITIALVVQMFVIEMAGVNRPAFLEYHVGSQGYIVFAMTSLVGGIVASALMGALGKKVKAGHLIFVLYIVSGAIRIVFAHVLPHSYAGGLVTMVFYATLGSALGITISSLQQRMPQKDMVGRVGTLSNTFGSIAFTLGALVGGVLGGIVADTAHVFIYQGITYIVIGLFIILIPSVRKLPKINDLKKPE
ncbi:MAG: MFS transporter [Defluviitaleaceae bacterium]|nr:MFS transporter [Defluviitaleaceae bacterium]